MNLMYRSVTHVLYTWWREWILFLSRTRRMWSLWGSCRFTSVLELSLFPFVIPFIDQNDQTVWHFYRKLLWTRNNQASVSPCLFYLFIFLSSVSFIKCRSLHVVLWESTNSHPGLETVTEMKPGQTSRTRPAHTGGWVTGLSVLMVLFSLLMGKKVSVVIIAIIIITLFNEDNNLLIKDLSLLFFVLVFFFFKSQ